MAHDSGSTPQAPLDEPTLAAVRTAISGYLGEEGSATDELRQALRALAAEARDKSVLPERLLVALKDIWYGLPDVRRIDDPADQVRLLQRVVTMCIGAYYEE